MMQNQVVALKNAKLLGVTTDTLYTFLCRLHDIRTKALAKHMQHGRRLVLKTY